MLFNAVGHSRARALPLGKQEIDRADRLDHYATAASRIPGSGPAASTPSTYGGPRGQPAPELLPRVDPPGQQPEHGGDHRRQRNLMPSPGPMLAGAGPGSQRRAGESVVKTEG